MTHHSDSRPPRPPVPSPAREQKSQQTTLRLMEEALRAFGEQGYHEVSLDRIAAAADLTKGAVYYHHGSKEKLFEAVFLHVQTQLVSELNQTVWEIDDPAEAIFVGCDLYLRLALQKELRQILLIDAPAVFGWKRWRELDEQFGLGALKEAFRICEEANLIPNFTPDTLAHLISGALDELVFLIAESEDREQRYADAAKNLRAMIEALFL